MAKLLFVLWVVVLLIGFGAAIVAGGRLMDKGPTDASVLIGLVILAFCALIAPMLKRGYDIKKPIDPNQISKESS